MEKFKNKFWYFLLQLPGHFPEQILNYKKTLDFSSLTSFFVSKLKEGLSMLNTQSDLQCYDFLIFWAKHFGYLLNATQATHHFKKYVSTADWILSKIMMGK